MQYRILGRTGLRISAIAFGAWPALELMTGSDHATQLAVLRRAVGNGINWIDTAPGYGQGQPESNLGRALKEFGAENAVHVATKVRLTPDQLSNIRDTIRRSLEESLQRLGLPEVTLLQLHNDITAQRDEAPCSLTPADMLGEVQETFQRLREEGLIRYLGLTGTGQPAALREVICSGGFDVVLAPFHFLNPSAGANMPARFAETNYGNIIADCATQRMGVLAMRVFAGGALLGQPPSAHTIPTPFYSLTQYERDRDKALKMQVQLGSERSLMELALRFALSHPQIHSAIIGIEDLEDVNEAIAIADRVGR